MRCIPGKCAVAFLNKPTRHPPHSNTNSGFYLPAKAVFGTAFAGQATHSHKAPNLGLLYRNC